MFQRHGGGGGRKRERERESPPPEEKKLLRVTCSGKKKFEYPKKIIIQGIVIQ